MCWSSLEALSCRLLVVSKHDDDYCPTSPAILEKDLVTPVFCKNEARVHLSKQLKTIEDMDLLPPLSVLRPDLQECYWNQDWISDKDI